MNTLEQLIREPLLGKDVVLVAYTERALQCTTSCVTESAQLFGLEVNLKTEVLFQSVPRDKYHSPHIINGATKLKAAHQFTYFGCTITAYV